MAKQVGLVRYNGTMGGVRHFKIKGLTGDFAGMKGGPSEEQVKNAPEFQRTRENMSEFSGCAKAGKSIRTALSELIRSMADPQVGGRLTSIMKKINLEDGTEARGQRKIEISTQYQYLFGFNFDRNLSFHNVMTGGYSLTHTVARTSADLETLAFNPIDALNAPAGATHFRLINAIAVISDFAYNSSTSSYEPVAAGLNEVSNIAYGSYNSLSSAYAGETITSSLIAGITLNTDVSVLQVVGIEFSQLVNGVYYRFSSGNCMIIDDIF